MSRDNGWATECPSGNRMTLSPKPVGPNTEVLPKQINVDVGVGDAADFAWVRAEIKSFGAH